jgi:TonB family protein
LAQEGGLVVVDIWVNRKGKVTQAEVRKSNLLKDPMLEIYAKQAAQRTVFNEDQSAPSLQKGTISYTFVAQ